ncbi:transposase [Vibrio jasicida]|uniref:transposase n=1 Tax=Vibrio jasicida TaxID=766224 RepID=UPI000CF558CC
MQYYTSPHSVYYTKYHVVWVTKYRRKILNPGIYGRLCQSYCEVYLALRLRRWVLMKIICI